MRKIKIAVVLLVFSALCLIFFLSFSDALVPYLKTVGAAEVQNAAARVMKNAVNTIRFDSTSLVEITRDKNGQITHIEYDALRLNEILAQCIETAESSLKAACEGQRDPITYKTYYSTKIIAEVPLGMIFENVFLQDKGPKIKISMKTLNSVKGNLNLVTKEYGLNNTIVEIDVQLHVSMAVIAPFHAEAVEVTVNVPIVIELVQGQMPNYTTTKIAE